MFLLLDAIVKVTAQMDEGGTALLAVRLGGDIVGEIALVDGQGRTATVSACGNDPVTAVRVSHNEFRGLLNRHPDAAISLASAIGRKFRSATRRRIDSTGCEAKVRLARALRELKQDGLVKDQDVVLSRLCGLRPEEYQRVVVRDKHRTEHVAWITVPGPVWAAPDGPRQRERLPPPSITAALIGAFAVIVAALITSAPALFRDLAGSPSPTTLVPAARRVTPPTSPPQSSAMKPVTAGTLHKEEAYHYPGTEVFRTLAGGAVVGGPVSIPFGTQVWVKCWAPNESGMSSVNAFHLVETSPWAGEYAPANTFLNADTSGAIDPKVPRCQATLRIVACHQLILLGRRKASCRR